MKGGTTDNTEYTNQGRTIVSVISVLSVVPYLDSLTLDVSFVVNNK